MALREPRRMPTPHERAIADRVHRAKYHKRDPHGTYHTAICGLAKQFDRDHSELLDQWDEFVSIRMWDGQPLDDAERGALDDLRTMVLPWR
jgi:hypothetical protein